MGAEDPRGLEPEDVLRLAVPVAVLVVVALFMGVTAPWYMNVSNAAAAIVVDPKPYIAAVLGPQHVPQVAQKTMQTNESPLLASSHEEAAQ